jgi:SAM-dependent methyltransferase
LAGGMGSRLLATSSAIGSSTERKRTWGQCIAMGGTSFAYSGTELHAFTEADNYYRWILSEFAPYLRERIIEVGAGIGTFSEFLLHGTNASELILTEPAENLFPLLQQRFSGESHVKLVHGYLGDLARSLSADSVVLVNVLEHIKDDTALLQTIHQILTPDGTILLFVPAVPRLYGTLDKALGHYRRYTKSSLISKLQKVGYGIVRLRYLNFPGMAVWFLAGKVLRRQTLQTRDVRLYDRWVVSWLSRLERLWEPPIGQSLIAIARK